jgi:hypothetical protein
MASLSTSPAWRARALLLATASGALMLIAPAAQAQAGDKAAADALFVQGRDLLNRGSLADACPKLEESLRLDRAIGTMLFLAECYQRSGKTASAWAQFREAQDQATKEGDPRQKVAQEHADRLAPILSTIVIRVTKPTTSLTVDRDGKEVGAPAWGTETPIDPGPHKIDAAAPGFTAWSKMINVGAEADHVVVVIPELTPAPKSVVIAPSHPEPKEVTVTRTWQRVVGGGLMILGVAGVGVGTGFGLAAISKNNDANDHCPGGRCDSQGIDFGHTANQQATISTIGFIGGAVFIVGGAVLFFTASHKTTITTGAQELILRF